MSSSRSGRGRRNQRDKGGGWEEFGGYMAAKVQKLENQFTEEKKGTAVSTVSDIFKGVSIFVNGYTRPSSDALKKLMQQHGGVFHHYYARNKVTHIIASNLPNSKIANLTDKKVCHPDWITQSIKERKLLPYQDFLLYKAETKRQPSIRLTRSAAATGSKTDETASEHAQSSAAGSSTLPEMSDLNEEEPRLASTSRRELFKEDSSKSQRLGEDSGEGGRLVAAQGSATSARSPAKAGDPNFLSEFYGHSRLHHISTWGSEMKAYVKTLQAVPSNFEAREKIVQVVKERAASGVGGIQEARKVSRDRVIMHIDMDSFFVSVGLRSKPELVGKPVAVTHSKGTGGTSKVAEKAGYHSSMADIASCSYEARECGVKNGMLLGSARKLCQDLVCIPYDFAGYSEVSHKLYDLVSSYTHEIEAVSCDEMFVDCTEVLLDTSATPLEFASLLRKEIQEATNCTASAGLGGNLLLARLATRTAKPNGQHYVTQTDADTFLQDIPVSSLPGVGRTIREKLLGLGVITCGDLQQVALSTLQRELGHKTGQTLYNYCRGKDERVIQTEKARKSVSAEINYGIRFTQAEEADRFVAELSEEVARRLSAIAAKGKAVTLKLKVRQKDAPVEPAKFMGHGRCDNLAKSVTLANVTDSAAVIAKESVILLKSLHVAAADIRGMGIQVSKLDTGEAAVSAAGVRTILQFTTKLQKPAEPQSTDQAESTETKEDRDDPEFRIPEPKPRELPPLPTLDVSSQRLPLLEFDSDGEPQGVSSGNQAAVSESARDTEHSYWPNASQIDEDVFKELPLDIQEEIRRMTEKEHATVAKPVPAVPLESTETGPLRTSQEPGCSHWEPPKAQDTTVKMPVFKQAPATPKKGRSPKKSPGKGRGRPRKVQGSAHRSPTKFTAPKDEAAKPTDTEVGLAATETVNQTEERAPEASLCGAVTLPDVKRLVTQWLHDSTEPVEDDVERFLEYASELVQTHNMEQLLLILRYLRRLSKGLSKEWIKTAEHITTQSKAIVHSIYGSELKL